MKGPCAKLALCAPLLFAACGYQLAQPAAQLARRGVRVDPPQQTGVGEPRVSSAMERCLVRELGRRGLRARDRRALRLESKLFALEAGEEFYAPRRVASVGLVLRFELRLRCAHGDVTLWRSGMLEARGRAAVSPDPASSLAARRAALEELGCVAGDLAARALYGWRVEGELGARCGSPAAQGAPGER